MKHFRSENFSEEQHKTLTSSHTEREDTEMRRSLLQLGGILSGLAVLDGVNSGIMTVCWGYPAAVLSSKCTTIYRISVWCFLVDPARVKVNI